MFNRNKEGSKKSVFLYGTIDERTKSIAYKGDAYACRFLLIAILLDVIYGGFWYGDPLWDLLLIVIIGGGISAFYQIKNKILFNDSVSRKGLFLYILITLISAVVMFLIIIMFTHK